MKKLGFIFIIIIGFSSTKTTGQIRVNPNGYVGINNLNPSYGLDIHAKVRFDNWSDFYVEWNGLCGAPTLYPERDWYLQLGHWEYRLGNGFFHGVHSYNYWGKNLYTVKTKYHESNIDNFLNFNNYKYNNPVTGNNT